MWFSLKNLIPFRIWPWHKMQFHCTNYSLLVWKMTFVSQLTESVFWKLLKRKHIIERTGKAWVMYTNLLSTWQVVVKFPSWYLEMRIGDGYCILVSHFATQDFILSVEQNCKEKSWIYYLFAKSCSTLRPHELQHTRLPVLHYFPEFAQTYVHWVGDAIQPFHPLSPLLLLPSIFASIRVFSSESALHIRWPKYWSFSFSISLSSEYSGFISFKIDWLISLLSKGLSRLLQYHSLKASIFCSAFFKVQLSHPYMTTGKTTALTIWTFVGKVNLLFNMLSRLVIAFLPKSKCLLISFCGCNHRLQWFWSHPP